MSLCVAIYPQAVIKCQQLWSFLSVLMSSPEAQHDAGTNPARFGDVRNDTVTLHGRACLAHGCAQLPRNMQCWHSNRNHMTRTDTTVTYD